jgi:hypothetical protein
MSAARVIQPLGAALQCFATLVTSGFPSEKGGKYPMSDDDGDAGNLSPEREDGGDTTTEHNGGKWTRFEDAQLLQVSRRYSAGEISTRPAFLQAMADALFGTRSPMACQSRLQMLKQGVKREPPIGERASLARAARPKRLREDEDDAMAIVPYKAARESSMNQILSSRIPWPLDHGRGRCTADSGG